MSTQYPQGSGWQWSYVLQKEIKTTFENGRLVVFFRDGTRMDSEELRALQNQRPRTMTDMPTDPDGLAARMQAQMNIRKDPEEGVDRHGVRGRIILGPGGERILKGTTGDREVLDESYRKRKDPGKFFKVGKVFLVLWVEPTSSTTGTRVTSVALGGGAYTSIRRFIVVRACQSHCIAVPILTYSGKGIHKSGINIREHALVYPGNKVPSNTGSLAVIQIDPDQKDEVLDPKSVANLGKSYTIEHNLKVKPFGMVRNTKALLEAVANARETIVQQGGYDDPAEGSSASAIQTLAAQWVAALKNRQITRDQYDAAIASLGQPLQYQSQVNQRAQAIVQDREEEEEEEEEELEEDSEDEDSADSSDDDEQGTQHYTHQ